MESTNKIKTIIIDDEPHWQLILSKLSQNIADVSIEAVFSDVETAYHFLQDEYIDLILLDIQIREVSGIDFIKKLHKRYTIIIVSMHSDFALDGYSISAIDYLVKPIQFDKFESAVQRAIHHIRLREVAENARKITHFDTDYFLIKDEQGIIKINYQDVSCITALENYIKIITPTKKYLILTTLIQFERSINNHPFLRIHRSHIVNLNHIKMLRKDVCVLFNDNEFPIGDLYRTEIHQIFVEGKIIKR